MILHRYGSWTIEHNPKPIPVRCWDWDYVHDEYDPEDDPEMCGNAGSLEEAMQMIDEHESN